MIDWTKPVETIGGKPVRVLATDIKDTYYPIVIAVTNLFGDAETVETVTTTGYLTKSDEEACRNLCVRNKKQKVWVNLYRNKEGYNFGKWHWHRTKEEADEHAFIDRFACVEVEI